MCETAPLTRASSPQDMKLLQAAKEKHNKKTFLKKKTEKQPNFQGKVKPQKEVSVLSSAALSSFKVSNSRPPEEKRKRQSHWTSRPISVPESTLGTLCSRTTQ